MSCLSHLPKAESYLGFLDPKSQTYAQHRAKSFSNQTGLQLELGLWQARGEILAFSLPVAALDQPDAALPGMDPFGQ